MSKKIETGLIIVKENVFTKIRRNIFSIFFKKENTLLQKISEIEKPKNRITKNIVIPKEIKKY